MHYNGFQKNKNKIFPFASNALQSLLVAIDVPQFGSPTV